MVDLYNNKYDRQTLKDNIYAIKLIDILKTQTLDVTFVVRYILNNKYQFSKEDEGITIEMVLKHQPHFETVSKKASWSDYIKTFESMSTKVPDAN